MKKGDVISMWTQGGGGYGPAGERDRAAIDRDLREGKITPEHIQFYYDDQT